MEVRKKVRKDLLIFHRDDGAKYMYSSKKFQRVCDENNCTSLAIEGGRCSDHSLGELSEEQRENERRKSMCIVEGCTSTDVNVINRKCIAHGGEWFIR